jgi:hypothetical protein
LTEILSHDSGSKSCGQNPSILDKASNSSVKIFGKDFCEAFTRIDGYSSQGLTDWIFFIILQPLCDLPLVWLVPPDVTGSLGVKKNLGQIKAFTRIG